MAGGGRVELLAADDVYKKNNLLKEHVLPS
jgi:hypothetical protein